MKLKWQSPPIGRGIPAWADEVSELKQERGKWAVIEEYRPDPEFQGRYRTSMGRMAPSRFIAQRRLTDMGHRIRKGRLRAFRPAGAYDAKARSEGSAVRLYVKLKGSDDRAADGG